MGYTLEEQYVDKDAVITRLQNEVMYLRQELEFIKKIIKSEKSRKRKL